MEAIFEKIAILAFNYEAMPYCPTCCPQTMTTNYIQHCLYVEIPCPSLLFLALPAPFLYFFLFSAI